MVQSGVDWAEGGALNVRKALVQQLALHPDGDEAHPVAVGLDSVEEDGEGGVDTDGPSVQRKHTENENELVREK